MGGADAAGGVSVAAPAAVASEQEEILWALAENAPRYNDWLLSRALPHTGDHVLEVGAPCPGASIPVRRGPTVGR